MVNSAHDHRPATASAHHEAIVAVLVHIQHHLDRTLSLEHLAALAHLSPFHFHRIFRGVTGESLNQHVRRIRLERAAHQLRHTNIEIGQVGVESGYQAHEAFTRAFGSVFGCSPRQFRSEPWRSVRVPAANNVHFVAADDHTLELVPVVSREQIEGCAVVELAPIRAAAIRHVGPYQQVSGAWGRLLDWVGAEYLFGPEHRLFGLSWDDPEVTPPDQIRYDACVEIDGTVTLPDGFERREISGGGFVTTTHFGPYHRIGETYSSMLGVWAVAHGEPLGPEPSLEFYLNDPEGTDPDELATDLYLRLEDR